MCKFNVGDKISVVNQTVNIPKKESDGFTYTSKLPVEGVVFFVPSHGRWVGVDFGIYKSSFFAEDVAKA